MRASLVRAILFLPLSLAALHADVTLRYRTEMQLNPALPAAVAASAAMGTAALPQETVIRFKNGKGFSTYMGFDSITDFMTHEITLLDAAGKRYAKVTSDQIGDTAAGALPPMPPQAQAALASIKVDVAPARMTGRTEVIQGVNAEEREIVISVTAPSLPNMPPGPLAKMVMLVWSAQAAEVMRVPALRELAGYTLAAYATMNPAASMGKVLGQLPGFADAFGPMMKEMQKGTVLRMHMQVFLPVIAAMMQRMPPGSNPFGPGFDANAPLMELNQEAAELSSASVPDSVFQIPEGYREAPAADMLHDLFARGQAAGKQ
jgi:hypothetical protein